MGYLTGYTSFPTAPYHDYAMDVVHRERQNQVKKWGNQVRHPDLLWLGILMEEVGELSKELIETKEILEELVQVAAVAVAWVEATIEKKTWLEATIEKNNLSDK